MENTENGNGMMGPSNAMWGNMNWGNTPPWWNYGPGYGYGPNGGQNLYDQVQAVSAELSNVKAAVAVNSQADRDLEEKIKLQNELVKKEAEVKTLESERRIDRRIDELNNQVITNAGILGCVAGKVNDLTQIGIPSANIITPPTGTATTSTAGA